jgi:aldehyde dehydrogenase
MAADDAFLDKAVEGFVLFAFNQGEVCTCPSRALIQEDIYEEFMEALPGPGEGDQAGRPARREHDGRRAGIEAAA